MIKRSISLAKYPCRLPGYRCVRWSSTTTEDLHYAHRKSTIESSPSRYYPTISSTRSPTITTATDSVESAVTRVPHFNARWLDHDFSQYPNREWRQHPFQIEAKIKSVRKSGKGMFFIDVVQDNAQLQLVASNKKLDMDRDQFYNHHNFFRRGDSISAVGYAASTNVGQLSLKLSQPLTMLSPCLLQIPDKLSDRATINTNRVLDYLVNPESVQLIALRSRIIHSIRSFFVHREFMEVSTPILAASGTGANAFPFTTHSQHNLSQHADNKLTELQLRVAPELWLKKLVIAGFDKVFEIGPQFRNEGCDSTHNPEFTTVEFYQSYASLDQLFETTEQLFKFVYDELKASSIPLLSKTLPPLSQFEQGHFPRYEFIPTLESLTNVKLPPVLDSSSLSSYHQQINCPLPRNANSTSALLDNLASHILEPMTTAKHPNTPVFLYHQPAALSPLAKSTMINYQDRSYDISLRFEVFINGKEYVNAYEEENSPFEQFTKFELQQLAKQEHHDQEALVPDWKFVDQMKFGLPPTGGWGCGVDRLCMLFGNVDRIEKVLPFGGVRDVVRN